GGILGAEIDHQVAILRSVCAAWIIDAAGRGGGEKFASKDAVGGGENGNGSSLAVVRSERGLQNGTSVWGRGVIAEGRSQHGNVVAVGLLDGIIRRENEAVVLRRGQRAYIDRRGGLDDTDGSGSAAESAQTP